MWAILKRDHTYSLIASQKEKLALPPRNNNNRSPFVLDPPPSSSRAKEQVQNNQISIAAKRKRPVDPDPDFVAHISSKSSSKLFNNRDSDDIIMFDTEPSLQLNENNSTTIKKESVEGENRPSGVIDESLHECDASKLNKINNNTTQGKLELIKGKYLLFEIYFFFFAGVKYWTFQSILLLISF